MNNNLKIKTLFVLVAFLLSAMYVMQTPTATNAKTSKANQGVTLKVLVSDQQLPDIQGFAPTIQADSNGLISNITVVSSASRSDDQYSYLQTLFTTGSSEFDAVSMDVIWPAGFADHLVDLSDTFNQSFMNTLLKAHAESMVWNGKVIAGPYFFDSGLVLYRKDILARNGLTIDNFKTWADWSTNLNKILDNATEAALDPSLEGYVFQGDAYEGGIVNLVEWMGASGGTFINNATGKANFAASAGPALTWMSQLVAPKYTSPLDNPDCVCVSTRSELIGDEGSAVTKWLADNAVFQRNWPFSYTSSINDGVLNGSSVLKFTNGTSYNANVVADPWFVDHPNEPRFGVTTLPYNATICGTNNEMGCRSAVLGGAVLGIPDTSTHITAAKFFLKEIASKQFQIYQATHSGNTPVLKSIYTDGDLNGTSAEYKNLLYENVFQHVLPRPVNPKYVQMSQAIQPIFHNGFSGALSIQDALTQMDSKVNAILGFTSTAAVSTSVEISTKTVASPSFEVMVTLASIISIAVITRIKKSRK